MSKKVTLAIETSGRVGSVAIGCGETLVSEHIFSGFMKHSAELFPTLEKLLSEAGSEVNSIEKVYISAGPGSFTGLRIAATTAKMLYLTQKSQIVAVDTMDIIAENATRYMVQTGNTPSSIATILDAKKEVFFVSVFDNVDGNWKKCIDTQAMTAQKLLNWLEDNKKNNVGLLGEGLVYYADKFESPLTHLLDKAYWSATAAGLFSAGQRLEAEGKFSDPYALTPKYIRQPDAVVKER